ncbi:MAG TPA: GDP-mannose 4,6-dehydratase [Dehalococcoidia bacterium]|nr:GDP-mannose 4,6-dehydratase [Dehalococcoidia bacterium]
MGVLESGRARKRALITGITGFVGSHMAELLLDEGLEVHGICRHRSSTEHIDGIKSRLHLHEGDLMDAYSMSRTVAEVQPDYVFHLAAQSFVPASWASPTATMEANLTGSVHLFEAIRQSGCDPVIQIAGSSEEYGLVDRNSLPITEETPLRPLSPYAVSKVAMDFLGYQYYQSYGLRIIRTRAFNHEGPRRGESFVTSNFAKQVAEIEAGSRAPVIHVGNLEAERDYTDVRDVVRAYWVAVNAATPGEVYNICSGKAYRIRSVLDMLLEMSHVRVEVRVDPSRLRPSDVPVLLGDCSRFRAETGWKPRIPFEKTMADLLQYWRQKLDRGVEPVVERLAA